VKKFLISLLGVLILAGVAVSVSIAEPPDARHQQAPGFYRAKLGAFVVTAILDGTAPRHMDQILSKPGIAAAEYAAVHETQPVSLSINAYLVDTGSHVVLIDTGAGELFGPSSGMLIGNLKAAGYRPEQIDAVLLTHIHGDHSGGLSVGGAMQFPNAVVYVDQRDLEYFVTRKDSPDDSETLRKQLAQSRATVGPYVKANKVTPIKSDGEIIPGIVSRSQAGHTPGHTAYLVQSEGHRLLIWGDVIHSSEVQFEHPEVTIAYDVNPEQAAKARVTELEFAARDGLVVGSAHISFPGLGHVRKVGDVYRWVPIPYNAVPSELDPG
jgi:glyoxylase-like metal-dependent hydrolase (beta-lactamase superfamily II)